MVSNLLHWHMQQIVQFVFSKSFFLHKCERLSASELHKYISEAKRCL